MSKSTLSIDAYIYFFLLFQDSTLMLTPLKNNEFQVSTTNQFSYLPYQQNLHNYNNSTKGGSGINPLQQQPFARTSKLRQNFGKKSGNRPKSVDFEVLRSVENICKHKHVAGMGITYTPNGMLAHDLESLGLLRASGRDRFRRSDWGRGTGGSHSATRV